MRRLVTAVDLNADDRRRIEDAWPEEADECRVVVEDGFLCARFLRTHERFERIRRITGYLTGTLDKWNDAKRAEERDRVKHLTTEKHEEHEEKGKEVSNSPCSPVGDKDGRREGEVEESAGRDARGAAVPPRDGVCGVAGEPAVVDLK